MRTRWAMPFGAEVGDGGAKFRLWAPSAQRVILQVRSPGEGELRADLNRVDEGWFELSVAGFGAGAQYAYRIDDELLVPDPAARAAVRGDFVTSVLLDPLRFEWNDGAWRGRPWREAVIYEMHVGCFTQRGTYGAAAERLDELAQLGVTAIELMPLATFAGECGWGYDGVLLFAPHAAYGEPEDLKRFVQAAHARGLMVLLDVVYNHFGPEGNYLPRYAPQFFTARRQTPWGDAVNFAHPVVREFFIHNALYWLEEYRFDGLRIDAVHAMYDDAPSGFIDELIERVQAGPGRERCTHIVLENERNEARRLRAATVPQACGLAQWNDDFHHAAHVLLTGESDGYYVDYADRPLERLGRILAEGFAYQGEPSAFSGEPRGEPSAQLPPTAFVNFLQNHDQTGNRALGERLAGLADSEPLRAVTAVLLLAPQIPMLFMGEEYAASQPFLYFCDYRGELADAVRRGRRAEFSRFSGFASEQARARIPDPNAVQTFERSRLNWSERDRAPHAQAVERVRALLDARRRCITPRIDAVLPGAASYETHEHALHVRWPLRSGAALVMHANLGENETELAASGELLYSTAAKPRERMLKAWEVRVVLTERGCRP